MARIAFVNGHYIPICAPAFEVENWGHQFAANAWMIDDTRIGTEGSRSNAWIVAKESTRRTRATWPQKLAEASRECITTFATTKGLTVQERPTNTAGGALAIAPIYEKTIGSGVPRPVCCQWPAEAYRVFGRNGDDDHACA